MNVRLVKTAFFALSSLCVASIAGCDAQDDGEGLTVTERTRGGTTKECGPNKWLPKSKKSGYLSITPGPDGDPIGPGWPLSDLEHQFVKDYMVEAAIAQVADHEALAQCESVCKELEQSWDGSACAVDAAVEVGEAFVEKTERGLARSVEADAEVALGCSCQSPRG